VAERSDANCESVEIDAQIIDAEKDYINIDSIELPLYAVR